MEKINLYRDHIKKVISLHSLPSAYGDSEIQQIFDSDNDHYQLVHAGWHDAERLYGCIIHLDIKDGKIWVQYDGTEDGVANQLVEFGVPREDIVLAYHPPYKRKYSGFGTA